MIYLVFQLVHDTGIEKMFSLGKGLGLNLKTVRNRDSER